MEPHGFLSGKCKHGSPNFCTLCDIEGNPERYTNQLLADVIQEVEEYRKMPLSERLQNQLLAYKSAQHSVKRTGLRSALLKGDSMAKEMIDYISEIHKVAGSQVGVHFGEKSPYHIREILRICEAAQQSFAPDAATLCDCGRELQIKKLCQVCDNDE